MPNELQKAYLAGANAAYIDVADKCDSLVRNAPPDLKELIQAAMEPFGIACRLKAKGLYDAAGELETIETEEVV